VKPRITILRTDDSSGAALNDAIRRLAPQADIEIRARGEFSPESAFADRDLVALSPTELHRLLEEASARAHREAGLSNERFLGVLFHELRTPLTPILAWAQLLRRSSDQARIEQAADVIERNVRIQLGIVDDILDINRLVQGSLRLDRRPHDLRQLVGEAVAGVREAALEKRVAVDVALTEARPIRTDVDDARIKQLLGHLLSNAVRFTPREGSVGLTVRVESGMADIRIRDAGLPLAEGRLPTISEPFGADQSGGRTYGTAGIQLALAHGLAQLHGGTLEASSPGVGVEFVLRLPLAAAIARSSR
jgi:signal transduction histidine kinase